MEPDEFMEDILLGLLVHNVENKQGWIGIHALKIKFEHEDLHVDDALSNLMELDFIEQKNDSGVRITSKGIDYIINKV